MDIVTGFFERIGFLVQLDVPLKNSTMFTVAIFITAKYYGGGEVQVSWVEKQKRFES